MDLIPSKFHSSYTSLKSLYNIFFGKENETQLTIFKDKINSKKDEVVGDFQNYFSDKINSYKQSLSNFFSGIFGKKNENIVEKYPNSILVNNNKDIEPVKSSIKKDLIYENLHKPMVLAEDFEGD